MAKLEDEAVFSRSEVLKHNNFKDCWVIIQNDVYDLTPFVAHHPGGADIILSRAGEEATSFFIGKHGKNDAVIKRLAKFRIGTLIKEEQIITNDFDEPFLMDLIEKCYKQNLYNVPSTFYNKFFWIRAINISGFFTLSLVALYGGIQWWLALILVLFQGLIGTSLFGFLGHEATHRQFPKRKLGKSLLNITWPIFWPFIAQGPLRYEHNSHHVKIGDPDYDYEVAAFASFIRYSGSIVPNKFHKYQHKFARYIYPFYANIITTIGGVKSSFWSSHSKKVVLEHNLSIIMTFTYYVVIPWLIIGNLWWFLSLYLVYQCVLFYGIYVGAAINHFVPQVTNKIPDGYQNKFAYYVCHNTTNFGSNNKWWFWYTGGFNIQIEHHLMPFVPVENLRSMIPIVKDLCKKYNYPYKDYRFFKELWNAHYEFLEIMSSNKKLNSVLSEKENKEGYFAR